MPSFEQRFFAKVTWDHDCWRWTGFHDACGYGRAFVDGKVRMAHRVAFEFLVGPIPKDKEIDHLCRNRGCVNPLHLQPVSHKENMRRGLAGAHLLAKTHCPAGHEYEGNARKTFVIDADGTRHQMRACRLCGRTRTAAYKAKNPQPKVPRPRRTHCPQGHEYSTANTYFWVDKRTNKTCRYCRACAVAREVARATRSHKKPTVQAGRST